jgi:hypothetical protein
VLAHAKIDLKPLMDVKGVLIDVSVGVDVGKGDGRFVVKNMQLFLDLVLDVLNVSVFFHACLLCSFFACSDALFL